MREFAKAADLAAKREAGAGAPMLEDTVDIVVAERPISVKYPNPAQHMYLSMLLASEAGTWERAGGLINFIVNLMEEDDRRFIKGMLLDPDSGFDHEDIEDIVEYLVEEWSARPTARPADYKRSQRTGGPSSTGSASRRASTRSRSTRAVSATSSTGGASSE